MIACLHYSEDIPSAYNIAFLKNNIFINARAWNEEISANDCQKYSV